jgi:predicted Zn-dependent protease with MMP-like domain
MISHTEFMLIVEQAFEQLPETFKSAMENVAIAVEDVPTDEIAALMKLRSKHDLLGLYQGIPLPQRGSWYGMTPVSPDRIYLYQQNIEMACGSREELEEKIKEVLIHEIGHYYGMSEEEIRAAGY